MLRLGCTKIENEVALDATLSISQADEDKTLHFILLDGTWNNSAAMLKRLKVQALQLTISHMNVILVLSLEDLLNTIDA